MNVPNETLDRWRVFAELARATALSARLCFAQGRRDQGREQLQALHEQAIIMAASMERAGARRPQASRPAPPVPLELLDTPANRRYLAALRAAWEAGLAVDEERYGPTIGTDGCAQIIEMVLADVEGEIHGPAGMVPE